ncbi:hypothetical protein [Maridesulfovibrio hydrothermalis]|uniref:Uncharacterized protein n=1 Tax=Maridesulfovibrio hydrothermalis AM13 = DSM 14728 TaxID=1121451 RepID=L0RDK1_9BACT|nr:hypothetical protein [Maridesulfovibrio hydrothermalis]CCO23641.1 conserved protein of unknown function [Maridesulfovibrio hydrothermalis AM13 = DSM 14728]
MKKKLIEVGNLESFLCPDSSMFYVDSTIILTPGAKDELGRRKISIARVADAEAAVREQKDQAFSECRDAGDCVKAERDECENLVMGIAVMLKEEYGISDIAQLKEMSFQLAEIVRENI